MLVKSKNGVPLRLTKERWNHIITSHLDMVGNKKELLKTIEDPDMILKGVNDEKRAVRFFKETHLGAKYIMVAYKELGSLKGFIITAYKASKIDRIIKRGILWKRQQ